MTRNTTVLFPNLFYQNFHLPCMKSVLTIAASDPVGGAGIQADLKAFSYAGVHGCSVITCVTAQNTVKVSQIHEVPLYVIEAQLDTVLEDVNISACKTGMLYSPKIVKLVAKKCDNFDFPLVVDPVMKATTGGSLHESGFLEAMIEFLVPRAALFTPNIPEAEAICGIKIETIDNMKEACKKIHALGCRYVLLKGGHLKESMATDILFDGEDFRLYMSKGYQKELHGTGCTFSALITAFLAREMVMGDAIGRAKLHISNVIKDSYMIGKGAGVPRIMPRPHSEEEIRVIEALAKAVDEIEDVLTVSFIPEVGINIGFALADAKSLEDVCALKGRMVRVGDGIAHLGAYKYGASKHVAKIILSAMKFDKDKRCAMNIKYNEEIIDACGTLDFSIGEFDRSKEPKTTSTMEWGTEFVIKQLGQVPDIIYDKGGIGKEAMIRILGKNPEDVLKKLKLILKKVTSKA